MRSTRFLMLFTCFLLSACAFTAGNEAFRPGRLVWPPSPLLPRFALSAMIRTPEDAEIRKGVWKKVWSALIGEEDDAIQRPHGLHADASQRLLVVDTAKRGVHLFDRKAGHYTFISGPKTAPFLSPIGVTEDGEGMLYITDSATKTVYRCRLSDLAVEPFITAGIKRPTGIAYNPTNNLIYVADTVAAQIVAFDTAGREVLRFGEEGSAPGRFNRPTDLAVDAKGRVLVTDALNCRVQIFSREGGYLKGFGEAGDSSGHFAKAKGVAVDSRGHIYVCDALFDAVQVFNEEGELLLSLGNRGSAPGEMWMPSGIFIDSNDLVYVADTYNQRIQVFSYLWQGWAE